MAETGPQASDRKAITLDLLLSEHFAKSYYQSYRFQISG
jgi:hypothetical protein